MLQYVVGPAAGQDAVSISLSQTTNCPTVTQPSLANISTPVASSHRGARLDTSGVVTGDKSPYDSTEPEVISPSSENRDVVQPTVVVDLLPVAPARVPKKRGRKPKRRRRAAAAAALSGTRPPTSTVDLSAGESTRPVETTSTASQPSLDNRNSLQKDAVAPDEARPAPKKRGRKPKKRPEPEPEIAVVEDVVDESGRSPLAKSPGNGSRATTAPPATTPVVTDSTSATPSTPADNDSSTNVSTSGVNGNRGAESGSGDAIPPRRRGRKRKNTSASDQDEQRQAKLSVDETSAVQSVWKVTSPATAAEYPCNGHVPRIKVTNIRRSAKTAPGDVSDAGATQRGTVVTPTAHVSGGGRQAALKVKSWQPMVRRTDSRTAPVPVLDRAREWIDAVPKPSRDDWTGPVFPARDVVDAASRTGSTTHSQPPAARPPSPTQSVSRSDVELNAGSPSRRPSGAENPAGRVVGLPGSVAKTGVIRGPGAPPSVSQLMCVLGGAAGEARFSPAAAAAASRSRSSPDYAHPVISSTAAPATRPVVCSFDKNPRSAPYTTKRVSHLP